MLERVSFRFDPTNDGDGSYFVVREFDDEDVDDELLGRVVPHYGLARGYGTKSQMSLRHATHWAATADGLGLESHDERTLRRELKRWKVRREAAAELLAEAYAATGVVPLPAPPAGEQ